MTASLSRREFELLVQRAGLTPTPAQMDVLFEGWGLAEPMLERVRAPARDRAAEPATTYRAEPAP